MPRPSTKEQRSKEILEAYLTCISKFGLDGATQDRIADEAGVKRTILRHYFGNKEEMVSSLATYLITELNEQTDQLVSAQFEKYNAIELVNVLFDNDQSTDHRLTLVYQAIVFAVETYPTIRIPLLDCMTHFIDFAIDTLRTRFPTANSKDIDAAAHGIIAIHMSHDALAPLRPSQKWKHSSKQAAIVLLHTLGDEIA